MKRLLIVAMVLVAATLLTGATRPRPTRPVDPSARNLALGVELIKWNVTLPEGGWTKWSPRPDVTPGFAVDRAAGAYGVPALRLSGGGRRFVYGGWRYEITGLQGSKPYRFFARLQAKGVPSIRRNILCRITWKGEDFGNEIQPVNVNEFEKGQGYAVTLEETFIAPARTSGAVVELLIQWAPYADVTFSEVSLEPAQPARARTVKVATVYWRPTEETTAEKNVEGFVKMVDQAAAKRPDVILLPEAITSVGHGASVPEVSQKMPGDAFFALAPKARRHKCYIIYGAYEEADGVYYNSAFIIDRNGTLAGTYRKVQLPTSEIDSGLSPGDLFRTFELDFGKVGILICHDTAFSEGARVEMLDGAEIIFVPIWGGDITALKARAIDNGLWVATSGYDVPSMIIDPIGQVASMTWKEGIGDGVAFHMINLTDRFLRPWIGDWRNQVIKQRRSDAYMKIVEE